MNNDDLNKIIVRFKNIVSETPRKQDAFIQKVDDVIIIGLETLLKERLNKYDLNFFDQDDFGELEKLFNTDPHFNSIIQGTGTQHPNSAFQTVLAIIYGLVQKTSNLEEHFNKKVAEIKERLDSIEGRSI